MAPRRVRRLVFICAVAYVAPARGALRISNEDVNGFALPIRMSLKKALHG